MTAPVVVEEIESRALGRKASFVAYVPRLLGSNPRPVIYLLHGATGSHLDWSDHAHEALLALAQRHQLIIINPDGGEYGWYLDSDELPHHRYETFLIEELLPHVESRFQASSVRSIGGLSMGGHGAITLAWKYPTLFSSVSSMSGVVDLTRCRIKNSLRRLLGDYATQSAVWHGHSSTHLMARDPQRFSHMPLRISCGESDYYFDSNCDFSRQLDQLGVTHVFESSPGGHEWDYWTRQLPIHIDWHAQQLLANA